MGLAIHRDTRTVVGYHQPAFAADHLDAASGHQAGQSLVQPADHSLRVADNLGEVDLFDARVDAELRSGPSRVCYLRGMQDRLGRNASPMQAGTTDLVLLDQADAQPQLGCPERT